MIILARYSKRKLLVAAGYEKLDFGRGDFGVMEKGRVNNLQVNRTQEIA